MNIRDKEDAVIVATGEAENIAKHTPMMQQYLRRLYAVSPVWHF
jgi:hypothetical protein